ncbi:MAG: SMC-Scp complex subunit ScpB [Rhizobiales bacterium]|nr:SMC-Scp complex subunit ScpB [Hyphomicrobiales bacterium]
MAKELGSDLDPLDVELSDLPQELRWREWMCRIEAIIFASGKVVPREMLQKVIGKSANLELLIEDIQAELKGRPYELVAIAGGWMHRTRPQYSNAIHAAADLGEKGMSFTETEMTVLATIAYHQPISRAGLNELFGREVSRDLISRLQFKKLVGLGPRSPQRGAPFTYVTTVGFLAAFDLKSLRDLPDQSEVERNG